MVELILRDLAQAPMTFSDLALTSIIPKMQNKPATAPTTSRHLFKTRQSLAFRIYEYPPQEQIRRFSFEIRSRILM
jgi:hypothetical protein